MAIHAELSKNNCALVKDLIKANYGDSIKVNGQDINLSNATIQDNAAGRLSFNFILTSKNNNNEPLKLFVKIPKDNAIEDNADYSVSVTEFARTCGVPCPQTYTGNGGAYSFEIPDNAKYPQEVRKQKMTIVEYTQPQQIKDFTQVKNNEFEREMGRLMGRSHARFDGTLILEHYNKQPNVPKISKVGDPLSAEAANTLLARTFKLKEGALDKAKVDGFVKNLRSDKYKGDLNNLESKANWANLEIVAKSLENSEPQFILEMLAKVKPLLEKHNAPKGIIHSELKRDNLFHKHDDKTNKVTIVTAFDYDMCGEGAFIKDFARTMMFECFDGGGKFIPEKAEAMLQGYAEHRKFAPEELKALPDYLISSAAMQYALRSSYYIKEIHGVDNPIKLDRPNPSVHVAQIKSFGEHIQKNPKWIENLHNLEMTTGLMEHRRIETAATGNKDVADSAKRAGIYQAADAQHNKINAPEVKTLAFAKM